MMPHSKSYESEILRQPTDIFQDDSSSDSFGGFSSNASIEKDAVETELERMVFGDDAGFQQELKKRAGATKDFSLSQPKTDASDEEIEDQDLFRDVDDADLFFVDSGPSAIHSVDRDVVLADKGREHSPDAYRAAWIDSDDEWVQVSLNSNPRLRKLRVFEGEDYINGKDYVKRLRRQYERLHPMPGWASQSILKKQLVKKRKRQIDATNGSSEGSSSDSDASSDNDELSARPLASILQNAGSLSQPMADARHYKKLRPEVIDIQRSRDVGPTQPSSITSLAFHPLHPLLLSSGPAATLWLNHVSPQPPNPNPLLTSLHVRGTSIATSVFHPTARARVVFSGRRRYFHSWDLSTGKIDKVSHIAGHQTEQKSMEKFKISPCGRWMGLVGSRRKGGGLINVLDLQTSQWVAEVRVEGKGGVADFEWWGDGEGMTVLGKGGEAVEWDGRGKRVVARWIDDGAVGTTVVSSGGKGAGPIDLGGNRWIAVGSSSGLVNVYDRKTWSRDTIPLNPKPARAFDQLTTPISHLVFSSHGQILVMASRWKRDALRLIHLPSCTVYRNWPTSSTPLGRITSIAFSPNSELLAVANEQGKIRLWEL